MSFRYPFDLSKITEFTPALIYGLEPENSIKGLSLEDQAIDLLRHAAGQHVDLFNAYRYLQDEVLTEIRQKGVGQITADDMLRWLDGFHERAARTLAHDISQPYMAGHYTNEQVLRWHQGVTVKQILQTQYYCEITKRNGGNVSFEQLFDGQSFGSALKDAGVDMAVAKKYIALLHKYANQEVPLSPSEKQSIANFSKNELTASVVIPEIKVIAAYQSNLLSAEEKAVVDQLAKMCCRPEAVPDKMRAFAEDLAKSWNQCDPKNLDEIAELCRKAFFGITEIHPYFNCNGRTATGFVNLISRSLGHRSFLMRNPGDKSDVTSDYAKAIKEIDSNPERLKKHFHTRISEADAGKSYQNKDLKECIEARVECSQACDSFQAEFPTVDLNQWYQQQTESIRPEIVAELQHFSLDEKNNNKFVIFCLKIATQRLTRYHLELRLGHKNLSLLRPKYSEKQLQSMTEQLELLTGITGWTIDAKNHLRMLCPMESNEKAMQLAKALNRSQVLQAIVPEADDADDKPLLILSKIRPKLLMELQKLEHWKKPGRIIMLGKAK